MQLGKKQQLVHSGTMYKIGGRLGRLVERFYALQGNFLYYYNNQNELKPKGVIFLEGCFVEKIYDEEYKYFGIDIISEHEKAVKKRRLYCVNEEERDVWYEKLKKGANSYNITDFYEILEILGSGKFSHVKRAVSKANGEEYAVKVIEKKEIDSDEKEFIRNEIAILQLVHHPNVIRLVNVFEDRKNMYIITDLASGGDLLERIVLSRVIDEDTARLITRKVIDALIYLHEYGIVHRDLKPENIMLTVRKDLSDNEYMQSVLDEKGRNVILWPIQDVLIADFGLSKFSSTEDMLKATCGTLAYMAPEVLRLEGYGKEVDAWSMGVMLYVMLRGQLPFKAKQQDILVQQVLSGKFHTIGDYYWNKKISRGAKNLIRGLLQVDPQKRLTLEEALKHPWLTGHSGNGQHAHRRTKSVNLS